MDTWIIVGAVYVAGALATFTWNLSLVVVVTRPLVLVRNAIFWPWFVPILLTLDH